MPWLSYHSLNQPAPHLTNRPWATGHDGLLPRARPADASCAPYAGSTWWGSHNLSHIAAGKLTSLPQDFYIFSGGSDAGSGGSGLFDITAAKNAGISSTFIYWSVSGSGKRGTNSAYDWGVAQADAALNAWYNDSTWASYVGGTMIFAEIIPSKSPDGWTGMNSSVAGNEDVLNGWLDTIAAGSGSFHVLQRHLRELDGLG